jgi:GTPase SAR1 family protein
MPSKVDISAQLKAWKDSLSSFKTEIESDMHLQFLYDYLLNNNIQPSIFKHYGRKKSRPKSFILPAGHVGQMGSRLSLSPSQRQAIGHYLSLPVDNVLAVTGPPGTGKTTIIQTMVANSVVESALRGQEPALIVATSANNNAINNVIESFASAGAVRRWLPGVDSFGLYLTNSKQAETSNMAVLLSQKIDGTIAKLMTEDYYKRASAEYLKSCNSHFKTSLNSVSKARNHIHTLLRENQSDYKSLVKANNKRNPGSIANVQIELDTINQQIDELSVKAESAKGTVSAFKTHKNTEPGLLAFLSFISMFRRKLTERNQAFLNSHGITESTDLNSHSAIQSVLSDRISKLDTSRKGLLEKQKVLAAILKTESDFQEYCQKLGVRPDLATIDDELDTRHRARMFELAVHYWEARWLEELAGWLVTDKDKKPGMGASPILTRYRMHAKIYPCFISTGYSLPRFFTYYATQTESRPYLNEIDLLIFDEAGQIPVEVGAVLFALSKRAVVVGDRQQFEPVAKAMGSLMGLAHQLSEHTYDGTNPGLMLTEHQRCVPEIINYCNLLAYGGALKATRQSSNGLFPPMSFHHVAGRTVQAESSRYNEEEATAIVNWLVNYKVKIEAHYRRKLADCVGVITPFRPQFELISKRLEEVGIAGLTVGTTHSLQGAERDIVLFSAVYDRNSTPSFINDKLNLMNVAVSRAKDCFILFADSGMVSACPPKSPVGLLGKMTTAIN